MAGRARELGVGQRLVIYLLALVGIFGAGAALGVAVGPLDDRPAPSHSGGGERP